MSAHSSTSRITIRQLHDMKSRGEKIACLTAYDVSFARVLDTNGVDVVLVGDSLGMVIQGHDTTLPVTMDEMVYHGVAVARGLQHAMLILDMPFLSDASLEQAVANAGRFMKQTGAAMVKLEGGADQKELVSALTRMGMPVCAHIGLQPQTTMLSDGYKVQGKTKDTAIKLIEDAKELEEAGVFSITLEMISHEVAQIISETVSVPTIGIGSGVGCNGQILVVQDLLGMFEKIKPRFAKRYLNLSEDIVKALENYKNDVELGTFPAQENWFSMDDDEFKKLREQIGS